MPGVRSRWGNRPMAVPVRVWPASDFAGPRGLPGIAGRGVESARVGWLATTTGRERAGRHHVATDGALPQGTQGVGQTERASTAIPLEAGHLMSARSLLRKTRLRGLLSFPYVNDQQTFLEPYFMVAKVMRSEKRKSSGPMTSTA